MIKKLNFILLAMLAMVLIASCVPQPSPAQPKAPAAKQVEVPEAATAEPVVDDVAADISDAADIDAELDTSELDDIDSILTEIENI